MAYAEIDPFRLEADAFNKGIADALAVVEGLIEYYESVWNSPNIHYTEAQETPGIIGALKDAYKEINGIRKQ